MVEKAIAAGPGVAAALQKHFAEASPQLDRYRARFQQQAAGLAKNHLRTADVSLPRSPGFARRLLAMAKGQATHEELAAKGDPAMARLTEIFVVNRADALVQSQDFQADREHLQALGKHWEASPAALQQAARWRKANRSSLSPSRSIWRAKRSWPRAWPCPWTPRPSRCWPSNTRLASQLDPEEGGRCWP